MTSVLPSKTNKVWEEG